MDPQPRPTAILRKRSLSVNGRKTSLTMEDSFWEGFCREARRRNLSRDALAARIRVEIDGNNLAARIRVFVLDRAHAQVARLQAHRAADHSRAYYHRNAQPAGAP